MAPETARLGQPALEHPDGQDFFHLLWLAGLPFFMQIDHISPPSPPTPGNYNDPTRSDYCGFEQATARPVVFHKIIFKHHRTIKKPVALSQVISVFPFLFRMWLIGIHTYSMQNLSIQSGLSLTRLASICICSIVYFQMFNVKWQVMLVWDS